MEVEDYAGDKPCYEIYNYQKNDDANCREGKAAQIGETGMKLLAPE